MQVMDRKLLSSRAGMRLAEGDPPLSLADHSEDMRKFIGLFESHGKFIMSNQKISHLLMEKNI